MHRTLPLLVLLSLLVPGCFPRVRGGFFDDHAFYASREHYRIRYAPGLERQHRVLPAGWQLQNWTTDRDGTPGQPRSGPDHELFRAIDRNGDGRLDVRMLDLRHELFFEHQSDEALVWARTTPLEDSIASRSNQAIMREIVEAFVRDDDTGKFRTGPRIRLGARLLEDGPATIARAGSGAVDGWRVIFELHDLDRPEGDPNRVGALAYIVMARPRDTWQPGAGRGGPGDLPMAVFFGYMAQPHVFEVHRTEFESMLDRVEMH